MTKQFCVAACAMTLAAGMAQAQIRITEYMYSGTNVAGVDGEFIELTNVGSAPIDLAGWSFDDNTRAPGSQSLAAAGIVLSGQSIILCQAPAADFRTAWGLAASVVVIGGNANNLGRADEINIYDASNALVDRLTYDDQTLGGVRTQNFSGNTPFANLGANNAAGWILSFVGDAYGSHVATGNTNVANPGTYPVPTPGAMALAAVGCVVAARRRRK